MELSTIGIACKSIQDSINFYKLLGIKFVKFNDEHYEGTTSNGFKIMLDSFELMKKINPEWKEPINAGVTLCFLQNSPTDVNNLYQSLIDNGYTSVKEPWDAFWKQRYASVRDPNGNQVDIFSAL